MEGWVHAALGVGGARPCSTMLKSYQISSHRASRSDSGYILTLCCKC